MAKPIALCIERAGASEDERYVRCTARPGREAGLALGVDGSILWCAHEPVACEVWVSADQRLIAYRPAGAPEVCLQRARRHLALPEERPVVVLHQDQLVLDGRRFRLHVHGVTDRLHPPAPLRLGRAAAAAAMVALTAGAVQCGEDVGESSPPTTAEAPERVPASPRPAVDGGSLAVEDASADAGASEDAAAPWDASDDVAPIEVRDFPPALM